MPRSNPLITRRCISCGYEMPRQIRPSMADVIGNRMLGLSLYVSYRGNGKRQLRNAPAVHLCEGCMEQLNVSGSVQASETTKAGARLANVLIDRLRGCYSAMRAADAQKPARGGKHAR